MHTRASHFGPGSIFSQFRANLDATAGNLTILWP
jgi:hypothetical protein